MDRKYLVYAEPVPPEEQPTSSAARKGAPSALKTAVAVIVYAVIIPALIVLGVTVFKDRSYNVISIAIVVAACVPFFIGFEKGRANTRELVVIAVMSAISVLGRLIFAPVPSFKPVTAIVIITGIACGAQAGFLTGAVSAIVSNMMFGQGPWTPFQMFAWGFIGLLSGLIFRRDRKPHILLLILVGILGGALYSVVMDVWTVLSLDGVWNTSRYLAALVTALPTTAVYIVSNIVFLLLLAKPFLEKLDRIRDKYRLFGKK